MSKKPVAILHGDVPSGASLDEQDVLVEVLSVESALQRLGYKTVRVGVSLNLEKLRSTLRKIRPTLAFNLVESLDSKGRFIPLVPLVLDTLNIPYTGCPANAVYMTSNKLLAKQIMKQNHIPTPPWQEAENAIACNRIRLAKPFLIKSVWEHASIGLDDRAFITSAKEGFGRIKGLAKGRAKDFFLEQYIEGREFNLSMIEEPAGPRILPVAEMCFEGYNKKIPKIVGFRAKWDPSSFEFGHTKRNFAFLKKDLHLLLQLTKLCLSCWNLFGLRGYGRVDFRVDRRGRPYVLEVNVNPCISPDSGFLAAAAEASLTYQEIIQKIVEVSHDPEV